MADRSSLPLSGVRILDLTRLLPGPMCTLHLADLGAEVIKVEDTGMGDYARTMGLVVGDDPKNAMSDFFTLVNRNKRAINLDLKQPSGIAIFHRLVAKSDVVVESFRPGVMERLGVGYTALSNINPKIVFCSISGYGQTGPYRDWAGHDINYLGYSGVADQMGATGSAPHLIGFQIADLLGGAMTPAFAIMVALYDVLRTGRGHAIDVAMTDAVLSHAVMPFVFARRTGHAPSRGHDQLSGGIPAYNIYATSDGRYMAVGSLEPKFWQEVCKTLGLTHLATKGWDTGSRGEKVKAEVQAVFAKESQAYWADIFRTADCCVTPILPMEEVMVNEHIQAREMLVSASQPGGKEVQYLAPPFKLSGFSFSVDRHAPLRGADTNEVLQGLGYNASELSSLREEGVIS